MTETIDRRSRRGACARGPRRGATGLAFAAAAAAFATTAGPAEALMVTPSAGDVLPVVVAHDESVDGDLAPRDTEAPGNVNPATDGTPLGTFGEALTLVIGVEDAEERTDAFTFIYEGTTDFIIGLRSLDLNGASSVSVFLRRFDAPLPGGASAFVDRTAFTASSLFGSLAPFEPGEYGIVIATSTTSLAPTASYTLAIQPVPVPAALPLLAGGLGGLALLRRRRSRG